LPQCWANKFSEALGPPLQDDLVQPAS